MEVPLPAYQIGPRPGLPKEGRKLVEYLEKKLNVRVRLVSYGEERSQTADLC